MTYHPIEEPKHNPAAHRVWELVSLFQQAERAWVGLAWHIGKGYSDARDQQKGVLDNLHLELLAEINRSIFVLSIFTSGICGGLLGSIMGAAVRQIGDISKNTFAREFASATVDDAASQFGGTALDYLKKNGGNPGFEPPGGEHPLSYIAGMQSNISDFFTSLYKTIKQVILDIQSGKLRASEGERWYHYFSNAPFIHELPDPAVEHRDYQKEASLCLWIAWGAERDMGYWTGAWAEAFLQKPNSWVHTGYDQGVEYTNPDGTYRFYNLYSVYDDIKRWDPIIQEIATVDRKLVTFVTSYLPRVYIEYPFFSEWPEGYHLDVRRLMPLGFFSKIESAKAMSSYYMRYGMHMGRDAAKYAISEAFSGGSEFLRSK